jgi:hypothetical protein
MMKVQSSMVVSQVVNHKWPADVGYSSRHLNKWELLLSSLRLIVCSQVYSVKNYVTVNAVVD